MTNKERIDQGWQLIAGGKLGEAAALFQEVLTRDPKQARALDGLGDVAMRMGRNGEAVGLFSRALAVEPKRAETLFRMAGAQRGIGMQLDSVRSLERAIAIDPEKGFYHAALGSVLHELGQGERAVAECRKAIALNPADSVTMVNLSHIYLTEGKLDEGETAARQAVAVDGNNPGGHNNLSICLKRRGKLDEAEEAARTAYKLFPDHPQIVSSVGATLLRAGKIEEGIAIFRAGLARWPGHAELHLHYATALLLTGDFAQGWEEYEARFYVPSLGYKPSPLPGAPWDGRDLQGKTLIVTAEQGIGDTLQFCRFLPVLRDRGVRVVFNVATDLHPLLSGMEGIELTTPGAKIAHLDAHVMMLSLARAMQVREETIPRDVPYLRAEMAKSEAWGKRVNEVAGGLRKVGICWAGNPKHVNDVARSIRPEVLERLAGVPNVAWFSLQKNAAALPALAVHDFTGELRDMSDTAALVSQLDLVITVDTSIAHLAGALGKPVWVMLPVSPDWRWMLEREDSPWYPTMRLFRQSSPGDWASVVTQIAAAIESL